MKQSQNQMAFDFGLTAEPAAQPKAVTSDSASDNSTQNDDGQETAAREAARRAGLGVRVKSLKNGPKAPSQPESRAAEPAPVVQLTLRNEAPPLPQAELFPEHMIETLPAPPAPVEAAPILDRAEPEPISRPKFIQTEIPHDPIAAEPSFDDFRADYTAMAPRPGPLPEPPPIGEPETEPQPEPQPEPAPEPTPLPEPQPAPIVAVKKPVKAPVEEPVKAPVEEPVKGPVEEPAPPAVKEPTTAVVEVPANTSVAAATAEVEVPKAVESTPAPQSAPEPPAPVTAIQSQPVPVEIAQPIPAPASAVPAQALPEAPASVTQSAPTQAAQYAPAKPTQPAPAPAATAQTAPAEKPKSKRGRKSLKQIAAEADLIEIPSDEVLFSKQYYSMGEVSEMFRVNQSLLRFWESEFTILQPKKNKKGDRHFRPTDIKNLHLIYHLLRQRKYTIEGAKEFLKSNKKADQRFEAIQRLQDIKNFLLELRAQL